MNRMRAIRATLLESEKTLPEVIATLGTSTRGQVQHALRVMQAHGRASWTQRGRLIKWSVLPGVGVEDLA